MGTTADAQNTDSNKEVTVVFVLGGPGSGKGTQCANIVQHFGYTHFSAGDLLRAEIKSGSENGTMIQNMIKEGKIVPSEVTVRLLQQAMEESGNDKFLIDGFPRNDENRATFESVTGIDPEFILFFDCPEEEMERRLLGRNQVQSVSLPFSIFCEMLPSFFRADTYFSVHANALMKGREDDNIETIRKRFRVYLESTLPVINYYASKGKVRKIDAAKPVEAVFEDVKAVFSSMKDQVAA